jgi:hypothetical protein
MQDISHLAAQKLKEINQNLSESVHEYDEQFKYHLVQIPYVIEEKHILQWYVVVLLQNIRVPLFMYDL